MIQKTYLIPCIYNEIQKTRKVGYIWQALIIAPKIPSIAMSSTLSALFTKNSFRRPKKNIRYWFLMRQCVICHWCSLQYLLLSWENAYFLFQEIEGRCAIGSSVILVSYCIISGGSLVLRRWTIFSFLYFLLVGEKAKEPTEREKSCLNRLLGH